MKRVCCLLLILFCFSGCTGEPPSSAEAYVELGSLAGSLLESGAFSENLNPLSGVLIPSLYGIPEQDIQESVVYLSTGATAEEFALFRTPDPEAAGRVSEALERRVADQVQAFESYVPAEVAKLNRAVIHTSGRYVFLLVAEDEKAGNILLEYLEPAE